MRGRRALPAALTGLGLLLLLLALGLFTGEQRLDPAQVLGALWQPDGSAAALAVQTVRLPRGLMAVEIGAALGVAGALMQAVTRNPLADPGLMGLNAAAGLCLLVGTGMLGITALPAQIGLAMAGALAGSAATWFIAAASGRGAGPLTLTLAGIAVGAVLTGVSTALSLLDPSAFDRLRHWSAGSLSGARMALALALLPMLVAGFALAAMLARALDALALGEDIARAQGVRPGRVQLGVALAVMILAGTATAAAGPIAFLGLMAPGIARRWAGARSGAVLAGSALAGAVLLLGADLVGRALPGGMAMPVSVTMAFLGAPALIAVARRMRPA